MRCARHVVVNALLDSMKPNTAYTAAGAARMIGTSRRVVDQALRRMATTGQLGVRSVGGGRVYFTDQAAADAFGAADAAEPNESCLAALDEVREGVMSGQITNMVILLDGP